MSVQLSSDDVPLRLLRLEQVGEITGLRRSMIYQLEAEGSFPRRVKLATRAVGWVESEVRAWIAARIATRDQINQRIQPESGVPRMPGSQIVASPGTSTRSG
ncbi:MAG: helix-turn-helix transcriptional regulator [Steroidobacteraceae bacterium]